MPSLSIEELEMNMAERVRIPEGEYMKRLKNTADLIAARNLDVLIGDSKEAGYSHVRFFSGFWPLFEIDGVVIIPYGHAVLAVI